jgi:hypothetical protein
LGIGDFRPYDVDFDRQGRIYIANNYGGSGMGKNAVIRIDDLTGAGAILFSEPEYDYGIRAVTVDREKDIVYYANTGTSGPPILHRSGLDGSGEVDLVVTNGVEAVQTIQGMALHENGLLYFAGTNTLGQSRVFAYNPATETVTASYSANLNGPEDVLAKDFLYVANANGADGFQIIRLSTNFSGAVGYGINAPAPPPASTNPPNFYGPRRFIAILNRKITIMDDIGSFDNYDKIVSIENINGANWETLPAAGDGQSLFQLFYVC